MIYICKDDKLNLFLEEYILNFIKINANNKIIGIDFEFNRINNKRVIALCQINFSIDNNSDIFLFYPPNIKKDIFVKLLTSNIIKVLHGGESLDIPYLFDNILSINDRKDFYKNLFDTRYMCEYYNAENKIDSKCRIYDLLLNMNVINKSKYDYLMKNDKLMGNIWDIIIDVKNMSKELINYCVYDVEFLPELYNKFPKNKIYQNIIQEIACINFTLRYDKILDNLFTNISQYNLTQHPDFLYNNKYLTYNEIYIMTFGYLLTFEIFDNLYKINYFKKFIELVIKNLLYNILEDSIKLYNYNILYIKELKNNIKEIIMV
jgi:hypothetical protein